MLKEALMLSTIPPDSWQINAGDPDVLTRLLGLAEFVVTRVEYDDRLDCVMVLCAHAHDVAACPACGTLSSRPQQYATRTVRDLSVAGQSCRLECSRRRFKCAVCGQPFTEVLAAIAPQARCTRRYEQYRFAPCRGSTLQDVARRERLGYKTVAGLSYRLAAHHEAANDMALVRRLGIDEIALKKGRGQYALVRSALDRRRVLTVLPERTKEALEAHCETWSAAARAAVTDVALDRWEP